MKRSTFGLPLLFIELLAGVLLLLVILLTASRLDDLLASRPRQAEPDTTEVGRLRALNTELTALLNLTRTQLHGLRDEPPRKEHPVDAPAPGSATVADKVATLAELQGEVAALTARDAVREQRLAVLEREKRALEEAVRERDATLARTPAPALLEAVEKMAPEEMAQQLAGRLAEARGLREEIDRLRQAARKATAMEGEKKDLLTAIAERDARIGKLRGEMARLATEREAMEELTARLREREARIADLEREGEEQSAWLREDEEEIGRLRVENDRLTAEGRMPLPLESPHETARLRALLREQEEKMTNLARQNAALEERTRGMGEDLEALRRKPEAGNAPVAEFQQQRDALLTQIRRKEQTIQELQRENSALAATRETDAHARTLQTEVGELKTLLERRGRELERLREDRPPATPLPPHS
ncbi:MAG: hypothetical protein HQM03_21190 [Magnetococcales bacterium]|nr:hypothetical protein [Magnetococcales bacterium]